MIGRMLAHYRLTAAIGAGGMGEVYRATDTKLGREVALKVLPPDMPSSPQRLERFRREAKALAALDHAGIVTVYSVEEADGVHFLTMQLVEGRSLDQLIPEGGMPLDRLLVIATALTEALAAAHEKGVVHRDLKPANVMVAESGRVKVLDFGLAKLAGGQAEEGIDSQLSTEVRTREGVVMGTVPYMSPEQVQGRKVDHRTDIFSLGVVLYEMATGQRPFAGDSSATLISAILRDEPRAATGIRAGLPDPLARTIDRCLKKNPDERPQTARDVAAELRATDQERVTAAAAAGPEERRRRLQLIAAVAAVAVLAVAAAGAWWWTRGAGSRWARSVALPEIARLVEKEDYYGAFLLARQAQPHLPGDPSLRRFWADHTFPFTLQTDPEGAEVAMKPYRSVEASWDPVGRTPMKDLRLPVANLRLRIVKEGYEPLEVGSEPSGPSGRIRRFTLVEKGKAPTGMILVPGGDHTYRSLPSIELADFWIDRYEVTNRQYKEFVDQGAYRSRDHWREPFAKDGRVLSWEEAMAFFHDTTGRPGPATWEQGTYPEGQADHPVSGVSWFEAAAYAHFAGKALPTLYHWTRAAGMGHFCDILLLSNFGGRGAAPVGSHLGVSPYGAYDMAGNVKEWCWNEAGGKRYIMGAGWNEPSYMFTDADAQSPWDRSPIHGFRCAKYTAPPPREQLKAIDLVKVTRDYAAEKPASNEVFRVYRSFYSYDRTELEPAVESVEEAEQWRHEKVSFAAAYGKERVTAHLFLPKSARPPYQTIVYFPSGEAPRLASSDNLRMRYLDVVLRSGRAVMCPVYKGTYERRLPGPTKGPGEYRDLMIQIAKDFGRSIDYLETRTDIDREKLAFYGISWGASVAPLVLAGESRIKTAVLQGGGLDLEESLPEVDPFNFAPRVIMPVLMLNGRYDFELPLEASQKPLFRLLGTADKDKRHVLFETGHGGYPMADLIKEILDWLDRHLGPVGGS